MLSKLEKLNKGLEEIADRHRMATAQIILRWNVQQGVIVIPKSVHRERIGSLDKPGKRLPCLHGQTFAGQRTGEEYLPLSEGEEW